MTFQLPVECLARSLCARMFHTCPACMTVDSETLPWSTNTRGLSVCRTPECTPSTNTQQTAMC